MNDPSKLLCPKKAGLDDAHCDGEACGWWIAYDDHPEKLTGLCGVAYAAGAISQLVQVTASAPRLNFTEKKPGALQFPT